MTDPAAAAGCVAYPCPPPVPLADWPDGGGNALQIPLAFHDFDAGAWCIGHEHGPGAEAIAEHLWLQWSARVGESIVCAYYHEPMGYFVAVLRAGDGRALKALRIVPPRGVHWEDSVPRRRTWARDTAIAAAAELRAAGSSPAVGGADEAWLRRQLGTLGRAGPPAERM